MDWYTNYHDTNKYTGYLSRLQLLWSCDIHLQTSTYQNIAKLLTHPSKMDKNIWVGGIRFFFS